MDKYFHNGQVQAERTTYYDDKTEQLLMAQPDGTLDSSYGGYRFVLDEGMDTGKIFRFQSNNTTSSPFSKSRLTRSTAKLTVRFTNSTSSLCTTKLPYSNEV